MATTSRVAELHQRYLDLSAERTRSRNRTCLVRRILWLMQARRHGGLSERALATSSTDLEPEKRE